MHPQAQEQKPTPPADLSLKFMAWDIKGIGTELKTISSGIQALSMDIRALTNAILAFQKGRPSKPPVVQDDIPF